MLTMTLVPAHADWLPFIINYSKTDYGSGTSTWRIAPVGQWTFFANQRAMLAFNGVEWSRYLLNNRSEVRGVALSTTTKRLYVSGENEYGYYLVAPSGELVYHCLSDSLPRQMQHLGNMFDFYESHGAVFLRGDDHILISASGKYYLVNSPEKMFASTMVDGVLYVATDHGVRMLNGNRLISIYGGKALVGKRINAMFPYRKGLMITTATDGLYYYNGIDAVPFHTAGDALMKRGVVCCAAIHGSQIAIGTIHCGLIILDMATGTVQNFDEDRGLQNNTVLSVAFDAQGNVWAGLDYGIDYVVLQSPFTYLYNRTTQSFGIGYSALRSGNQLYLGTDRGLYVTSWPVSFANGNPDIRETTCPSGPAWFLYRNGDDLFCLHDKGIFLMNGTEARRVTSIIGAWACAAVKGDPTRMFVGLYDGIRLLHKVGGEWVDEGPIAGIKYSCRYFRQTGPRTLKVYTPVLGTAVVYQLDASLHRVVKRTAIRERYPQPAQPQGYLMHQLDVTGEPVAIDKAHIIFPNNSGFTLFNRQQRKAAPAVMKIDKMLITDPHDSVVYQSNVFGTRPTLRIPYAHNSVKFFFQLPNPLLLRTVRYQYRLNGDSWSAPSLTSVKEYSDLREGQYRFEVRALLPNGQVTTDTLTFRVLPPWYRSPWAWAFYALLAIGFIVLMVKVENRRLERKKATALQAKDKELGQMKVEISQLEKDKLDMEIKNKSQEIANLVMNVARKNEILTDIKADLTKIIGRIGLDSHSESKKQLILVNGKIDTNIEGDEMLRKFEREFDVANNNFISKLRERFPELNHNEVLMCAYLKMDLSTKEIAPLMNLSVRGVETIRYRLRKKLGLERENNIIEFLNTL